MDFQNLSGHEEFTGKNRTVQAGCHHTWQTLTKAEEAVLTVLMKTYMANET